MFTLNNPEGEADEPALFLQEYAKYCIYQLEVGENGTFHYQGYVQLDTKKRMSAMKELNGRCHWEPRRGTHDEAKEYCQKEDTRSADGIVVEWGEEPSPGARSDLEEIREEILAGHSMEQIADDHFGSYVRYFKGIEKYASFKAKARKEHTFCQVYWGPSGTGKSTRAMYEAGEDVYVVPRPHGTPWFDGYEGQSVVVLDEFYGWLPFDLLLRMIDQIPLKLQTKGGFVEFVAKLIIITSNGRPREWYSEEKVPAARFSALERRLRGDLGDVTLMDVEIDHPWTPPEEDEEMEEVQGYDSDLDDDDS